MLDEPLSALDAKIRVELRQEIRRIQQQLGITTIYVTHDQEEALSLSDRVVVMSQGRIEQIGTPSEIYTYPETEFVAKFVGQINLLPVDIVNPPEGMVKVGQQSVRTSRTVNYADGKILRLAIRPEELNPGHENGANNLTGKVDAITYLGSIVRLRVDVEGNLVSMDMFNERKLQLPAVGDLFEFNFDADACWLL